MKKSLILLTFFYTGTVFAASSTFVIKSMTFSTPPEKIGLKQTKTLSRPAIEFWEEKKFQNLSKNDPTKAWEQMFARLQEYKNHPSYTKALIDLVVANFPEYLTRFVLLVNSDVVRQQSVDFHEIVLNDYKRNQRYKSIVEYSLLHLTGAKSIEWQVKGYIGLNKMDSAAILLKQALQDQLMTQILVVESFIVFIGQQDKHGMWLLKKRLSNSEVLPLDLKLEILRSLDAFLK